MATTVEKKVGNLLYLMGLLIKGEEIYSQNTVIQDELNVDERTLRRYLDEIYSLYGHIVTTYKAKKSLGGRKVTVYKIADEKDLSKILKFFLQNDDELGWVLQMVYENDPTILNELAEDAREELEKNIQKDKDAYIFITSPFEDLHNSKLKEYLKELKSAVVNREYRDITYQYTKKEHLKNIKCLKLLFMSNNWYLATESEKGLFRFLRVSFIKDIEHSKDKLSYQKSIIDRYNHFFATVQNPFTLNKKPTKAILQASKKVAKYFKKEMKPFFPSQEFLEEREDGSITFSVNYTQDMEILPFVKQWLPDIKIISPKSLEDKFLEDIKSVTKLYS